MNMKKLYYLLVLKIYALVILTPTGPFSQAAQITVAVICRSRIFLLLSKILGLGKHGKSPRKRAILKFKVRS